MLAIIPARGGSKRIPKKNLRKFLGKPLIHWTVEAARKAKSIERVVLSTDDEEIARACNTLDVEVPFLRPSELAQDDSMAIDNYLYTIEKLAEIAREDIEEFVVLHPTSPLRLPEDIDKAVEIFRKKNADSVISCVEVSHSPDWLFNLSNTGTILRAHSIPTKNLMNSSRQKSYLPNGAVFVFQYELLREKYSYYSSKTFPYIMPAERSVDIDTFFDFEQAELLLAKNQLQT